jgi:hypothetical protein
MLKDLFMQAANITGKEMEKEQSGLFREESMHGLAWIHVHVRRGAGLKMNVSFMMQWRLMRKYIPNLKLHNSKYPTPGELKSKIRYGNIEFDGDFSKDSPGSDLIRSLILDDKSGPLFITAWGGQSTIARALKSIEEQYEYTMDWEMIKKRYRIK